MVELVIAQKKELERYADELLGVRSELIRHRYRLREVWIADEMTTVDETLVGLDRRLRRIADEMTEIGYELLKAYEELLEKG